MELSELPNKSSLGSSQGASADPPHPLSPDEDETPIEEEGEDKSLLSETPSSGLASSKLSLRVILKLVLLQVSVLACIYFLVLMARDAYVKAYPWYATASCGVTSSRVSQTAPFSAEDFFAADPPIAAPFVLSDKRDTAARLKKQQEEWDHYETMWRKARESGEVKIKAPPDVWKDWLVKYEWHHEIRHVVDSKDPKVHWHFDRIGPFSSEGGYSWDVVYEPGDDLMNIQDYVPAGSDVSILSGAIYVVDADDKPIEYVRERNERGPTRS
jgi:hypothetical protein